MSEKQCHFKIQVGFLIIVMGFAGILVVGSLQAGKNDRDPETGATFSVQETSESLELASYYHPIGGSGYDDSTDCFFDADGNIYICGSTNSFGAGGYDFYVIKADRKGNVAWERTWGGVDNDQPYAIWVDNSGGVYVCGKTLSYGSGGDVAIVKWNAVGQYQWYRTWGGPGSDCAYAIYVDASGIYVGGISNSWRADDNALVIKWGTGNPPSVSWNYTFGSTLKDQCNGIFVHAGTVYLTGYIRLSASDDEAFVRRYSTAGVYGGTFSWNGPGYDQGMSIWIDDNYHIYVGGRSDSWHSGVFNGLLLLCSSVSAVWNKTDSSCDSFEDIWVGNDTGSPYMKYIFGACNTGGVRLYNKTTGVYKSSYSQTSDLTPYLSSVMGTVYGLAASGYVMYNDVDVALLIWKVTPRLTSTADDLSYPVGTLHATMSWEWEDYTPDDAYYKIICDGRTIEYSGYHNALMKVNVDVGGLSIGSHTVSVGIFDGSGSWIVSDEATCTVTNDAPLILNVINASYRVGTTGNYMSFNPHDVNIDTDAFYRIIYNGSTITSGPWVTDYPVYFNVDGLPIGIHAYNITVFDGYGGSVSKVGTCTVTNSAPTINHPADTGYVVGTTGNLISWTVTDDSYDIDAYYSVSWDSSNFTTGPWISGVPNMVNVDGLALGVHAITIIAFDGYGATASNTITCIVTNNAPEIDHPADITYVAGTTGHHITWVVTDDSTSGNATFTALLNGTAFETGTWGNKNPIFIDVNALPPGSFNFTIVVQDGYGMKGSDIVLVSVSNTNPVLSQLVDVFYDEGEIGNIITWYATDPDVNTTSYYVIRDGLQVASGLWRSNEPIAIPIDGLQAHTYNFTIVALDGFGGHVQDTILVHVSANPSNPSGSVTADMLKSISTSITVIAACAVFLTIVMTILALKRNVNKKTSIRENAAANIQPVEVQEEMTRESGDKTIAPGDASAVKKKNSTKSSKKR